MANFEVTQGYSGATITPSVGDTITVELPEIPATGYRWAFQPGDANVLAFTGDSFQLSDPSAVGGGGTHSFNFTVQATGSTQITCTLSRSWESGTPRDTFSLQVVVS